MKRAARRLLASIVALAAAPTAQAQEAFDIVRHAERLDVVPQQDSAPVLLRLKF
jgi:hypothetical protein